MTLYRILAGTVAAILVASLVAAAQTPTGSDPAKPPTVNETYAGLACGGLSFATLGDLPEGVLLRGGSIDITAAMLDESIGKAPEPLHAGLKKNAFFVMEQLATQRILLELAKQQAVEAKKDIAAKSERDIMADYVQGVVASVTATEDEIAAFYEENKDACGGATLDQMKDQLKQYVAKQKREKAIEEHIRTIGQRIPIVVAAAWTKEQAVAAKDNPVDKARASGKPTVVDFGADGCRPCEMMTPILADLKKKYDTKANVLFVHVREEQILAARYRISGIPVQAFFDKDGKEIFRHVGFFPQAEIEKKLAEMGVQ